MKRPRKTIRVRPVHPHFFWLTCAKCQHEFKREPGFVIDIMYARDGFYRPAWHLCNACAPTQAIAEAFARKRTATPAGEPAPATPLPERTLGETWVWRPGDPAKLLIDCPIRGSSGILILYTVPKGSIVTVNSIIRQTADLAIVTWQGLTFLAYLKDLDPRL